MDGQTSGFVFNDERTINEWINEWLIQKHKDGILKYDIKKSNKKYKRFTADFIDQIIRTPDTGRSGWNNNHFYYLEIVTCYDKTHMWLAISNTNVPRDISQKYNLLFNYTNNWPTKDPWQWRTFFRSQTLNNLSKLSKLSKEHIYHFLDMSFEQIQVDVQKFKAWVDNY